MTALASKNADEKRGLLFLYINPAINQLIFNLPEQNPTTQSVYSDVFSRSSLPNLQVSLFV